MSIPRLTAIVAALFLGTALAVGAYLDAQRGTPQSVEMSSPILEFGPSHPMPRPLRAPEAPTTDTRRRTRTLPAPTGLVRAPRPVEASTAGAALAEPATFQPSEGAGAASATLHGPIAN